MLAIDGAAVRNTLRLGLPDDHLPQMSDGAFDRGDVYDQIATRHPDAPVIVPPRSTAVPSSAAETAPTQRDRHLQFIANMVG
jgi:hypothetical protein